MEPIIWKTEYDTGIKEIDKQHHKLVSMLGDLQAAVRSTTEEPDIGGRLIAFIKHTKSHLSDEESLMRRISFSRYDEHKLQHVQLVDRLVSLLQRLKTGDDMSPAALVEFLQHWLLDHIIKDDAEIGIELQERLNTRSVRAD